MGTLMHGQHQKAYFGHSIESEGSTFTDCSARNTASPRSPLQRLWLKMVLLVVYLAVGAAYLQLMYELHGRWALRSAATVCWVVTTMAFASVLSLLNRQGQS